MPLCRVRVRDLTEIGVCHTTVRRLITCDIEGIEKVGAEVNAILSPDGEGFRDRHIDLLISRTTQRKRPYIAEGIGWLLTEDAGSVVLVRRASGSLNGCAPVSAGRTVDDAQRPILIRACCSSESKHCTGVVCWRTRGHRECAIGYVED